ncbi:MAG: colanic acid biosynthesis glycosyltransferase WcaL [Deltaproteobacteria bacterium]|nr:MAG: colanic acid biosynthesis glycosyltransferase WcaL [Deltaproteobacteria bacterium]
MTWLCNQVRYLPHAIESHIVCEKTENLDQFYLPNIHVIPKKSLLNRYGCSGMKGAKPLARLFWLWKMCRKIKPDIVHSHFGTTGWFDSLVVRLTRAKHVVTFYGLDVNMVPVQDPRWKSCYKALFKSADLFLCEGPHMAQCLITMGCPQDKVKVQHLGVEVKKIPFKPRKWKLGEPLRVLIAASFREKKGIPYALETLGRLQNEVDLEITIIGDALPEPRSQSEKQKILQVIEKYGLQPKTRMLGFQPYSVLMEQAYKHHIFLSPSVTATDGDTEGGAPVSIIELSASGMPILSTTHCDIPEIVIDGVSGYLVPERDVTALADKLNFLVSNPDMWIQMGRQGRHHIEKNYNVKNQAHRLGKIYDEVVKF